MGSERPNIGSGNGLTLQRASPSMQTGPARLERTFMKRSYRLAFVLPVLLAQVTACQPEPESGPAPVPAPAPGTPPSNPAPTPPEA